MVDLAQITPKAHGARELADISIFGAAFVFGNRAMTFDFQGGTYASQLTLTRLRI